MYIIYNLVFFLLYTLNPSYQPGILIYFQVYPFSLNDAIIPAGTSRSYLPRLCRFYTNLINLT